MQNSSGKLEINQSLKNYQYSKKVQKSILNPSENINEKNKTTMDLKEHCQNKKHSNIIQTKISTKSKKKRKKKKKIYINSSKNADDYTNINNNEEMEDVQDECYKQIENSQIVKRSNSSVKIFVRQMNKKYKNETVDEESLVSTKRTMRDIFSKILKDFKKERALIL